MTKETNKTELIVGVLFKLTTVEGVVFNFQNFWQEDDGVFIYGNEEYLYIPIDYSPPEKNLTLDNAETTINLPITTELISILEANNYFIDAIVEPKIMLQDFPNVPLIADDKATISSYSIQDGEKGGGLSLLISSPFNALGGRIPNLIYTTGFEGNSTLIGYIPEVPISNSPSIN